MLEVAGIRAPFEDGARRVERLRAGDADEIETETESVRLDAALEVAYAENSTTQLPCTGRPLSVAGA